MAAAHHARTVAVISWFDDDRYRMRQEHGPTRPSFCAVGLIIKKAICARQSHLDVHLLTKGNHVDRAHSPSSPDHATVDVCA